MEHIKKIKNKETKFTKLTIRNKREVLNILDARVSSKENENTKKYCGKINEVPTNNIKHGMVSDYSWAHMFDGDTSFFCILCVVFSSRNISFIGYGFSDWPNVKRSCKRHEENDIHAKSMASMVEETLNLEKKKKLSNYFNTYNKNNERAKEIVKLLKASVFLVRQGLSFRGKNEKQNSHNKGNLLELIKLLESCSEVKISLPGVKTVQGSSSEFQNKMIKSIYNFVYKRVFAQITNSPFISLILDETTDNTLTSLLSLNIRYMHENEAIERFITYIDVSNDRSAESIFKIVEGFSEKF